MTSAYVYKRVKYKTLRQKVKSQNTQTYA